MTELLQFGVAADKTRKPTSGGCLKTRSHRACRGYLVDLDRNTEPLDRDGAERLDLDVAFCPPEGSCCHPDSSWICELLHPCRKVCRLADSRVVHMQIAADGPDDNLA